MNVNEFEKAKAVRRVLANKSGEIIAYTSWGEQFSGKEIRESGARLVSEIGPISLSGFSAKQCDDLDFGTWSDENPIRLIPVWLYRHLAKGDELTSISGKKVTVSLGYASIDNPDYIDNDNRMGFLAYGIYPKGV